MLPFHVEQHDSAVSASLLKGVAENWLLRDFETHKVVDGDSSIYKIDYYKEKLNCLETFDEGEITFAGRIRIKRFYLPSEVRPCASYKDFITKVTDVTCK